MTALRERPTLLLVALLAVVGALLSYAIVAPKPTGRTEQFWIYVRSRTSIPRTFDRALALEFADTLCLEKPISNVDARNAREFTDFDEGLLRKLSPQRRAEVLVLPVIRDATFKIVCPVTKHLPEHPRRDLLAGFPLPRGTVLDDDPVLDRADDDPAFTDEDDPKFRSATYLPPQSMSFDDLKRFVTSRVRAGKAWGDWSWCGSTTDVFRGRPSDTYEWERHGRRLSLTWSEASDDLVHTDGTRLVDVLDSDATGPDVPRCGASGN